MCFELKHGSLCINLFDNVNFINGDFILVVNDLEI